MAVTAALSSGIFCSRFVSESSVKSVVNPCAVSSYLATPVSSLRCPVLKNSPCGLQEDIVDTGNTLSTLTSHFATKDVASFSVCTLLDKPSRRVVPLRLGTDGKFYRGFECPDEFVVGYGMDFAEQYRCLPYIGVLKPHVYTN